MIFSLDKSEIDDFLKWKSDYDKTCVFADPMKTGASGGRFTYSFTPTTLGTVVKVTCACGQEVDVTDYNW